MGTIRFGGCDLDGQDRHFASLHFEGTELICLRVGPSAAFEDPLFFSGEQARFFLALLYRAYLQAEYLTWPTAAPGSVLEIRIAGGRSLSLTVPEVIDLFSLAARIAGMPGAKEAAGILRDPWVMLAGNASADPS